jgi:hypothetical protein
MEKYFSKIISLSILLPSLAFAQAAPTDIPQLLNLLFNIIRSLTPIMVAAALLFFFWGLARFIWASGNLVDKEKGRDVMVWGIIALFVMISVWGIVLMLQNSFIGSDTSAIDVNNLIIEYP